MVYLAGIIILLHNFVPHEHHDDFSIEENEAARKSADDLLDFLKLAFHADLGDGHLENFNCADGLDLDLKTSSISIFSLNAFITHTIAEDYYIDNITYRVRHVDVTQSITRYHETQHLRGPPSIS